MLAALAALALIVFLGGELFAFVTSDLGRVLAYRHLHMGDRDQVVRITGKRVREGLAAARIPRESYRELVAAGPGGGTPLWQVDLPPDGAPMQVNYAVSEAVRSGGAQVLAGHEETGPGGAMTVRMELGFPGRKLHDVVITRPARIRRAPNEPRASRLALVLVDAGEDARDMRALLARGEPFAVGVPALGEGRAALRRLARAGGHELVLQVPMEPENYPRINPGPGTLLVSMSAQHVEHALHGDIAEAGDVVAVSNLMGSFATQDEPFMTAVYHELRQQSLPFLLVAPVPRSVCRELASRVGVAYDEPDTYLDLEARESKPVALERAWKAALDHAQRRGQAIVVLRVTHMSADWLAHALEPKSLGSVTLVPLSAVLHRPSAP